ncbi:hypothetical protein F5Y13DRAFT_54664 [Hypoxylon sp. FL1857]|nr:hypothetical protein F5Y13DRAFT_54664 [Hypoxylon sp. FL1857]
MSRTFTAREFNPSVCWSIIGRSVPTARTVGPDNILPRPWRWVRLGSSDQEPDCRKRHDAVANPFIPSSSLYISKSEPSSSERPGFDILSESRPRNYRTTDTRDGEFCPRNTGPIFPVRIAPELDRIFCEVKKLERCTRQLSALALPYLHCYFEMLHGIAVQDATSPNISLTTWLQVMLLGRMGLINFLFQVMLDTVNPARPCCSMARHASLITD